MKPQVISKKQPISADHPQYEKKSKKSFLIRSILGMTAGGVLGFTLAYSFLNYADQLKQFAKQLFSHIPLVQYYVLPVLYVLFTIFSIIYITCYTHKAKLQINNWDGEDNDYIDQIDFKLGKALIFSGILLIISSILYATTTYNLTSIAGTKHFISIGIAILLYLFNLIYVSIQQNRIVKLVQIYNPEKKGSVYDKKFQDVWLKSCDEAERYLIYECTYKTFQFMNSFISTLFFAVLVIGMFVPIGVLCPVLIGVIWLVMQIYYGKESLKAEHRNKINN